LFAEAGNVNFKPRESLEQALAAADLAVWLESLPPAHQHYIGLKKALMMYRTIAMAGGWPLVAAGPTIKPGDNDVRIPDIIRRLSATGDIDPMMVRGPMPAHYSPLLEQGVVKFQLRHGLDPDGVIGAKTLAAMNVPVQERIRQIIINMTRWRWQERDLGEKYIIVNIAHFDLTAFEEEQEVFRFPVIVGKFQQQTPVFSNRIAYIDINPYWNIPPAIARNEELPNLRKDPEYLKKRHVRLLTSWEEGAHEIDSTTIDWNTVSPARMGQYLLRQDPGPWNALGRIKFVFPNTYNVYLHDTPTQNLFSRNQRNFSHGCIRVSDPLRLAVFVLSRQKDAGWTPETIKSRINENKRVVIRLDERLPVHITYQTAWIDKSGIVCFNNDVYGRDKKLLNALFNEEENTAIVDSVRTKQ
jgi:murein L,D-transpeptidase YcbB/YkuD